MKNKENILGLVVFIGLISHYVFGYFFWDKFGTEKLYSITAYFCMDVWGLVVFLIATSNWLKGIGAFGMALGTYYFYMEFNDPLNWQVQDYKGGCTFLLLMINLFFVWYYTGLLKKIKK